MIDFEKHNLEQADKFRGFDFVPCQFIPMFVAQKMVEFDVWEKYKVRTFVSMPLSTSTAP